jgi:hypothetical protein
MSLLEIPMPLSASEIIRFLPSFLVEMTISGLSFENLIALSSRFENIPVK